MGTGISLITCAPNHDSNKPQDFLNIDRPFCGLQDTLKELNREKIEKERFIKHQNSVTIQNNKQNKIDSDEINNILVERTRRHKFNENLKKKSMSKHKKSDKIEHTETQSSLECQNKPSHPIVPIDNSFTHPKHNGNLNIHFRKKHNRSHIRTKTITRLPIPPPRRDKKNYKKNYQKNYQTNYQKNYIIRITSDSLGEYELTKQGLPINVNDLYDAEDEETEDDESDE
eukprot:223419_1